MNERKRLVIIADPELSKEEVEANLAAGKPYVIRFNMPTEGTTRWK